MRSLSPSRTFTCTRTVSPDFIAGRSASCDCSTTSMAPIVMLLPVGEPHTAASVTFPVALVPGSFSHEFTQNFLFLVVQRRVVQKLRPPGQRTRQRLPFPPATDFGMVARQQNIRHLQPFVGLAAIDFCRPRVLRKVEQSAAERI